MEADTANEASGTTDLKCVPGSDILKAAGRFWKDASLNDRFAIMRPLFI